MWDLWRIAQATRSRPSDIVGIAESWAAYQFDNAVVSLGIIIENALQEQKNVGTKDKPVYENKYTITQLLDEDFRIGSEYTNWVDADIDNDPQLRSIEEGLFYEMVD